MEIIDDKNQTHDSYKGNDYRCRPRHTRAGRIMGGLVVIGVGAVLLARQMGVEFPSWLFTWPMLLVVIGIYAGAKHQFGRGGWFVPIIIGFIFLFDDIFPSVNIGPMFWPVLIIAIGLLIIFKPHGRRHWGKWDENYRDPAPSGEDTLETVTVFGGVKKNIISKNFKGGEVTCVFGGAEINLSQADIQGTADLEITCVLGGAKLIVPANWEVQPELVAVLGGIEDKRPLMKDMTESGKKLIIRGTTVFGGIEIRSF